MILVPKKISDARFALCEACPHLKKNVPENKAGKIQSNTCDLCGCYMPVKVTLKGVFCPANKW